MSKDTWGHKFPKLLWCSKILNFEGMVDEFRDHEVLFLYCDRTTVEGDTNGCLGRGRIRQQSKRFENINSLECVLYLHLLCTGSTEEDLYGSV